MFEIFITYIYPVLLAIAMILWIYCVWFFHKYDKDSNRLILLLILNIFYVPFYLFRIKNLRRENEIKRIGDEIFDYEFIKNTRENILDELKGWSNTNNGYKNQEADLISNLTEEMFFHWESSFRINTNLLLEAFNEKELALLNSFDKSLSDSKSKFKGNYPNFSEFTKSNDWKILHKQSTEILKEMI